MGRGVPRVRGIGERVRALLRERVPHPGARAFAEAVTRQVAAAAPEREAATVRTVLRLLDPSRSPEALARALSADAPLLAACFQNVDLLYGEPYDAADAVGAVIMDAVGRLDPSM